MLRSMMNDRITIRLPPTVIMMVAPASRPSTTICQTCNTNALSDCRCMYSCTLVLDLRKRSIKKTRNSGQNPAWRPPYAYTPAYGNNLAVWQTVDEVRRCCTEFKKKTVITRKIFRDGSPKFWYLHWLSADISDMCQSFTTIGRRSSEISRCKVPDINKERKRDTSSRRGKTKNARAG